LKLNASLSKQDGIPAVNLRDFHIHPEILNLVPKEVCVKHTLIPVNRAGSSLIVAMSDPSNIFALDDLKFLTGHNIDVVVASEAQIRDAIARYYP
jgi:type IV pilus assembly protein PilB